MKDDGTAFPISYMTGNAKKGFTNHVSPGMTLRDFFAGQALVGFLANSISDNETFGDIAENCFKAADAMLVEKDKRRPQ